MGSQPLSPQKTQARPSAATSNGAISSAPNNGLGTATLSGGGGRFNSLARQSSIYSLTLDEFQNVLTEPGKNFGSMNMDEFLKNIWTAEESQAMAAAMGSSAETVPGTSGTLTRQSSLQRQGSITLPRTLSRKTVDEVWKDIHRVSSGTSDDGGEPPARPTTERQQTFAEMTLEDFLVKAGVMREDAETGNQGFSAFVSALGNVEKPSGVQGDRRSGDIVPTLSLSPAMPGQGTMEAMQIDEYNKNQAVSQQHQQAEWLRNLAQRQQQLHQQQHMLQQQHAVAEASYVNVSTKRMGNGTSPIPGIPSMGMAGPMGTSMGPNMPGAVVGGGLAMGFGGPMVPGMAGNMALTPNTPPSPDSDGGQNGLSLSPMQYGMDGSLRGRKRGPDGPVEKVVERRQRRMIKNRESAARSRARKQAYTVELEAEVSQLKEENSRLRKQQVSTKRSEEEAERRKKQILDFIQLGSNVGVEKPKTLRRTRTATW